MYQILYVAHLLLLAPGPVNCKPKTPLTLTSRPGGGAKSTWPKLPAISVLGTDGAYAKVQSEQGSGFVRLADLKKICGTKTAKELSTLAALEEASPESAVASASPETPKTVVASTEINKADMTPPDPSVEPAAPILTPPVEASKAETRVKRASKDDGKTKVAVLDLKGSDSVPKELRESIGGVIPESLDGLGPFKAISKQDIEQMLALEAMKETVGCSDVACLAEIGGALGADYMVTGSLIRVDQTYMLQLQLLNIRTSRPEQRVTREYRGGPEGLFEEARSAVKLLVRELLNARSGTLDLKVSEEGATVRIDGSIVGTSPMPPLSLAGGLHTLTVDREGFVRQSQDVNIKESVATSAEVVLLPSEEFKQKYLADARLMRGLAWGFTALGAVALGGGVALFVVDGMNSSKLQKDVQTFNAAAERTTAQRESLQSRQSSINTLDALSVASMVFGVVSVGVGVTLFVVGESPSKYDDAKQTTTTTPATSLKLEVGVNRVGLAFVY